MQNEYENFSPAYVLSWVKSCRIDLCTRLRLPPEATASTSIPAAPADRLEDTKVTDEVAVQPVQHVPL